MEMQSDNAFTYKPLDGTIRLLRLSRTNDASIIVGELEDFSLDSPSCPDFMSVSYVWGTKAYSKTIMLNGHRLPVLQSVYPFLEMIACHQDFSPNQWCWIDSICINQNDTSERSSQVQLMGRIFKQAQETIVWLGEESRDSADAMDFLHLLANRSWQLKRDDGAGIRELRDPHFTAKWQAVESLLLRPWWTRVWTLQEFIIAPTLKFYCGVKSIQRSLFKSATYGIWLCNMGPGGRRLPRKALDAAWHRRRLHKLYSLGGPHYMDKTFNQMSIVAMLAYVSDCSASDPRDRIYSLLGLAKDRELVDRPDYDTDVVTVYSKLVKSFVEIHKSLDVICFAHLFNHPVMETAAEPPIPSWVPDWRAKIEPLFIPLMASQSSRNHVGNFGPVGAVACKANYEAAGAHEPRVTFSQNLQTVTCEGIFLDYIDGLGGLKDKWSDWTVDGEHVGLGHPCVHSTSPENQSPGPEDNFSQRNDLQNEDDFNLMGSISRCLVLDREDRYLSDPAPPGRFCNEFQACCLAAVEKPADVHSLFLDWFQINKSLRIKGRTLEDLFGTTRASSVPGIGYTTLYMSRLNPRGFLARFRESVALMARRLTVTDHGQIGMAPCRARKGDMVCVLLGCSIPVVLRPHEGEDTYEFIGECYLHGYMNGEILAEVETGQREIESFRLS